MCIIASFASFIGSREHTRAAEQRLVRLQVGWERTEEGNPYDPVDARMQMSIHVKVVGLLLVQRGHVPTRMLSRTASHVITRQNAVGTQVCRTR